MEQIFRVAIAISTITYAAYILSPYIDMSLLDQQTLDVLTWDRYGAIYEMPVLLDWFFVFLWLPLAIGMWVFNPLARTGYLGFSIFFLFLLPFEGLFVATGFEMMLYQATSFLDGAILVMAYFTGLNKRFKNS